MTAQPFSTRCRDIGRGTYKDQRSSRLSVRGWIPRSALTVALSFGGLAGRAPGPRDAGAVAGRGTIFNAVFLGDAARADGGALAATSGALTVDRCTIAGNSAGELRPIGSRVDIGADEVAYAIKAGQAHSGDFDASGMIGATDVAEFIETFLTNGTVVQRCIADIEGDGFANGADVHGFIALLRST
ncbi:MAG: hypothetical protein L6Q92_16120 [Phycisphaerae bacterium]|nr:hypothetical protein [Phycisphaerae bacterium]